MKLQESRAYIWFPLLTDIAFLMMNIWQWALISPIFEAHTNEAPIWHYSHISFVDNSLDFFSCMYVQGVKFRRHGIWI